MKITIRREPGDEWSAANAAQLVGKLRRVLAPMLRREEAASLVVELASPTPEEAHQLDAQDDAGHDAETCPRCADFEAARGRRLTAGNKDDAGAH